MYRQARRLMRDGRDLERARALLEAAAAIDPNCEAVYRLGEWYLAADRPEAALLHFSQYMEIDPTEVGSYLMSSAILARLGRPEEARAVLERGLGYVTAERERQVPRPDPHVAALYNAKAKRAYEAYGKSVQRLSAELSRLGGPVPR